MNEKYTLNGVVNIIDTKTNEIVYTTHNMIVATGRELILNAVFNGTSLSLSNFKKFYETTSTTSLTKPEDTYDGKKSNIGDNIVDIDSTGTEIETKTYKDEIDTTNLCMKLYLDIQSKASNTITSPITAIGLLYTNGNSKILFSRAAIDPVYMQPNREYVVDYKIYF